MKALVYGEILWDICGKEETIGGAQLNFAAHLAHLGDEAYLITAVGDDDLGKRAVDATAHHGIHTDFIKTNAHATGATLVSLDADGIPCYDVLQNTAYDNIEADAVMIEKIKALSPDLFNFNTLCQRGERSRKSLEAILENCSFKEIFCDINLRKDAFSRETLKRCLQTATILKISDEEGHFLYDLGLLEKSGLPLPMAVAKAYPQVKIVLYTLGADGSQALDTKTGILYESGKPPKTNVVSTVGAGDCFGATFVSVLLSGGTIPEAIRAATERCCLVVASKEAVPF